MPFIGELLGFQHEAPNRLPEKYQIQIEWVKRNYISAVFQRKKLGGGFKHFLFLFLPGEMIQFDEHIFQMGWFDHHLENELGINVFNFFFEVQTIQLQESLSR